MNKSLSFMLSGITLATIMFTSCGSTSVILPEHSPFAVVTVSGSQTVSYLEEKDDDYKDLDGILTKGINNSIGQNNPEIATAQDRLDLAAQRFETLMQENGGLEVISKDVVINSPTYSTISEGIFKYTDTRIRANDYKSIDELGSKKSRLLMSETGSKSLVYLDFTFNKIIADGSKLQGKLAAGVTLNVSVYNDKGKNIIEDTFTASSTDTVEIYHLGYDKEELLSFMPDLIDLVINQFIVKYM